MKNNDDQDDIKILMNNNCHKKCNIINYNNNIKNKINNGNNYKISFSTRIQNLLKNINNEKMLTNLEDDDNNTIFTQNVINSINNFSSRSIEEDTTTKKTNNINCNNQNNNFILLQNYYHNENNNKSNKQYIRRKNNYTSNIFGSYNDINNPTDINILSDDNMGDNNLKFIDEKIFKNLNIRHTRLSKSRPIMNLNSIFDNEHNKNIFSSNISSNNSKRQSRQTNNDSNIESHLYLDRIKEDNKKRNYINGIDKYNTKKNRNSVYSNLYRINNIKDNNNKKNNFDYNIMPVNNFKGIFKPLIF
jgi:hypothetical protein